MQEIFFFKRATYLPTMKNMGRSTSNIQYMYKLLMLALYPLIQKLLDTTDTVMSIFNRVTVNVLK